MGTLQSPPPPRDNSGSGCDGSGNVSVLPRLRLRHLPAVVLVCVGLLAGLFVPAAAAAGACGEAGCVDVVAVDGIIDDIVADSVTRSIEQANAAGDVVALVLQMDSPGSAVPADRLNELARTIATSKVPVSIWIGASGAQALGGAAELALVADSSGIAPGARIGDIGETRLDPSLLSDHAGSKVDLRDRTLIGEAAVKAGVIDSFDPILVDHIGKLATVESKVVTVDGKKQRQPVQRVRLSKLPLPVQIMHTAASPSVAYLLLVIGASLLLFEFFTAGVGVAGVVGAGFTLLGGYGLGELPHRTWALGLFVLAFLASAIDMQTGLARLWTAIGFVAFVVASLFLFVDFRPTWLALVTGIGGMAALVFRGMPAMNRARFGTPYIGREWLEGESGELTAALAPVGTVHLRGADWTARAATAFEGRVGDVVTVVSSDRLTVEVTAADPERGVATAVSEQER